jgi:hypothetical protein
MRRKCAGLRSFLLLAVALAVAVHPVARSFPSAQAAAHGAQVELQMVICTAHGAVLVDEPLGLPPPGKDAPACAWCAIAGGGAAKLAALLTAELCAFDAFEQPRPRLRLAQSTLPSRFVDWPAHAPRGPPRA